MARLCVRRVRTLTFGQAQTLFSVTGFLANLWESSFLPEPGGRSFIMQQAVETKEDLQLVLVLNWFEELRAKLGR